MNSMLSNRVMSFANVVMRVPPLFIIDELLRISLGVPEENGIMLSNTTTTSITNNFGLSSIQGSFVNSLASASPQAFFIEKLRMNDYFYQTHIVGFMKFFACCMGILASLYTFMLWTEHLLVIYLYLMSIGTIFLSYWSNVNTMKAVIAYSNSINTTSSILDDILCLDIGKLMNNGPGILIVQNYLLQTLFACIFCYIHLAPRNSFVQKLLVISFLAPSGLAITPLPENILHHAPVFAVLLPLCVCKFIICYNSITMLRIVHTRYVYVREVISNYGLSALAEIEWVRLKVPNVLRTFWVLRMGEQMIQILGSHYGDGTFSLYSMGKTLLVNGCETLTAVLGMTSIISCICHHIGCFFQWVLSVEDEDEKNIGTVSAILFYILALQTGLTSLDRDKRLVRLCRNFCLLFTAVLHFVHNIVNPLLMSLSASYNPALHRHLRALAVCVFLVIFPVTLLVFLWSHFTLSTWLLAVTVFSIEVIVKVLVSLATYVLFLVDACRTTFWEEFDDYVYLIKAFGNTIEFAFGIVLFFNGFWILVFESGGAIRAIMMGIHAYFNIWSEAKAGWSVFMKRRTAVNKINSLPEATVERLRTLEDVCAICYQEMKSAKVTRCNHYFHGVCLRKWLYVQDRCPLCHNILYKVESEAKEKVVQQEADPIPAVDENPSQSNESSTTVNDNATGPHEESPGTSIGSGLGPRIPTV